MSWKEEILKYANHSLNNYSGVSIFEWAKNGMRCEALAKSIQGEKITIDHVSRRGMLDEKDRRKVFEIVEELKKTFHLVETSELDLNYDFDQIKSAEAAEFNKEIYLVFISDDTAIDITMDKKSINLTIEGFDKEKNKEIVSRFAPYIKRKRDRPGRVCTFLGSQQIEIVDLGKAGQSLIRDNYSDEVVKEFDSIVEDFSSGAPTGNLVVLDGPPGTGKSYFVRGLVEEIKNAVFVIVPSSLIGHISDPNFMPAVISLYEEERVPIVLILEDADTALLPRGPDNMSTISDLLNFADGIVGSIIDLKIIATTNAKKMEIEPALLRKGRLKSHLHIGKLISNQASKIFKNLTGVDEYLKVCHEHGNTTLADVYALAKDYNKANK